MIARQMTGRARALAAALGSMLLAACASDAISIAIPDPAVSLGSCTNLQVPAGSRQSAHAYATGVQIYRWNDTSWTLVSPSAVLTSDAAGNNTIGIHYAGPTWQGVSGSKTSATVVDRCTPSANAIPWLLLGATSTQEAGVFQGTRFIHRVNTTGGLAPTAPGKTTGELASVPYTAEYFFYR